LVGLLAGLMGGAIGAQIFAKTGPQGEQGPEGEQGSQGLQGIPGIDGTNSILQILQNRNDTQIDTINATKMQWHNLSDFDSLMKITMNVQQNSRISVQFSSTHQLEATAYIWVRIVVGNTYNSSTYMCSVGPPAAPRVSMPGHVEFLTDSLTAGPHTINVQFLIELGSPIILDRTLTAIEIASQ